MTELLTKTRLNALARTTYGPSIQVVFYKVTPTGGETEIATLTQGFFFVRERRAGQEIDGSGVRFWLSADAAISRSQLSIGGVVAITVKGITTRYKISELLPMQQLGAGYVMRLSPQKGATG
jgi:hypothetical protein